MQNVFDNGNFNVHFKNENISANLPCQNNAECFRRACFAVPIETAGRDPQFPDEFLRQYTNRNSIFQCNNKNK
jgi:hypothetical protein